MKPTFYEKNMISLQLGSTSKGNQDKWRDVDRNLFVKGAFWYQGRYWKDYLVEVIASEIGDQLNLSDVIVVKQYLCSIVLKDGMSVNGCFSDDFSVKGKFVPFKKLMKKLNVERFEGTLEEKFDTVLGWYAKYYNVNAVNYVIAMFLIDYLVANEDRHYNNFGILDTQNGFRFAPLFDFGMGLFEGDVEYELSSYDEAKKQLLSKPFYNNAVDNVACLRRMFSSQFR